jgi:tight adherence protein C
MGDLFLYLGTLMMGLSVYLFVSMVLAQNQEQQVLSWATGDEPVKSRSPLIEASRPLIHRFCLGLVSRIKRPEYREEVRRKIAAASLGRELNVDEFIGLQILWGVLLPALLIFMNFALQLGLPLWLILLGGGVGYAFPHLHANKLKKDRYTAIITDLPFFIDLLALSTEAGLDFIGSIQRVVEKAEGSALGEELGTVLKDLKLGSSRADALRKMADRLDIPEILSFVVVLIDADSTGASIGKVLKQQSVQMRLERFTRAEKAGARASQLILVPMMMFIIPAVFIMVFGPVAIKFLSGGS